MKNYLLLALAAVALCFTACKKDNPEPTPVAVTGVSLDKTMVALEIDESATVKAIIAPENATNKVVEWSVADTAVATVANGVVTGVAVGETTLTATTADGGHTATIPVKVVTEKVPVEKVLVNYPPQINEGEEDFITVFVVPLDATNRNVTITLSDPEVLSIEYKGPNTEIPQGDDYTIKGLKPGTCKIKAVSEDGGIERECTVTVKETVKVTEIRIGPENATIEVGETRQFAAAINPSDADNKEIEWSSSDTSVATVKVTSNSYIAEVTGVGKGTATITATAKDGSGVKGEATITVVKKPTSITFDGTAPYEFNYWQGKVIDFKNDLKMKVEPADADFSVIEWGISINSARADVSGEEVKYEIKDNNITLSYAHSTNWVADETVGMTAYVDGVEIGSVSIIMENRGRLFYSIGLTPYYDLAMQGNKMNWDSKYLTELKYICYNKMVGSDGVYDKYQIPSSEYTLTSSDESKIKVTKNDDGISWMIERLNTTDLVAVTLTYKCGEHTQTYTINLIP
ncbi:MAG: Ig-like domain-containing protein [Alistipes sp.]|nr:Ig-like domain-containing protein [Alistipes sp.]